MSNMVVVTNNCFNYLCMYACFNIGVILIKYLLKLLLKFKLDIFREKNVFDSRYLNKNNNYLFFFRLNYVRILLFILYGFPKQCRFTLQLI